MKSISSLIYEGILYREIRVYQNYQEFSYSDSFKKLNQTRFLRQIYEFGFHRNKITFSFGLRERCSETGDCLLEIHKYFLEVLLE